MKKIFLLSTISSIIFLYGCDGDTKYVTKTVPAETNPINEPIVISHRGASGYLPEHTLAGYELAVKMGADFIEPDLQLTKDGYLVAVHDETLARTTNVLDIFGPRVGPDGVSDTNVAKYTLDEIKQLDMKLVGTAQFSYPGFTPSSQYAFKVPTFDEVIELALRLSAEYNKNIGIYPEAKLKDEVQEDKIIEAIEKYGYDKGDKKIFVQSFSAETLKSIKNKMENRGYLLPLVQLGSPLDNTFLGSDYSVRLGNLDCQDYCVLTQDNPPQVIRLDDIKEYAPHLGLSISTSPQLTTSSSWPLYSKPFYDYAHERGMTVTGWTFSKPRNNALAIQEYLGFYELGMDAVFSNYPDIAIEARDIYIETQNKIIKK